jgi:hypothetical protein
MLRYDLTGMVFGRLTVIRFAGTTDNRISLWECLCVCGNTLITRGARLRVGRTKSCGCLLPRHDQALSAEYKVWSGIKDRCLNRNCPSWDSYGGRGIGVCNWWMICFQNFIDDMGPRPSPHHSIERTNNSQGYNCGHCNDCLARNATANCRWATLTEQNRNKRTTIFMVFDGVSLSLPEWADITGISQMTLRTRKRNGWSDKRALTQRVQKKCR